MHNQKAWNLRKYSTSQEKGDISKDLLVLNIGRRNMGYRARKDKENSSKSFKLLKAKSQGACGYITPPHTHMRKYKRNSHPLAGSHPWASTQGLRKDWKQDRPDRTFPPWCRPGDNGTTPQNGATHAKFHSMKTRLNFASPRNACCPTHALLLRKASKIFKIYSVEFHSLTHIRTLPLYSANCSLQHLYNVLHVTYTVHARIIHCYYLLLKSRLSFRTIKNLKNILYFTFICSPSAMQGFLLRTSASLCCKCLMLSVEKARRRCKRPLCVCGTLRLRTPSPAHTHSPLMLISPRWVLLAASEPREAGLCPCSSTGPRAPSDLRLVDCPVTSAFWQIQKTSSTCPLSGVGIF